MARSTMIQVDLTHAQQARLAQIEREDPDARIVDYTLDLDLGIEPIVRRSTGIRPRRRVTRGGRVVMAPDSEAVRSRELLA